MPESLINRTSIGVQVTEIVKTPEFAFTGDTTSQFILDDRNKDVLDAKLLVMEVCGLSLVNMTANYCVHCDFL